MMRGFSLGVTDYLIKPLRIEDLRYIWILWKHIAKTRLSDKEAPKCMKHDTLAIEEPKSSSNSKKRKVAAKLNDDGNDNNSEDEWDNGDSSSSKRTCLVWTIEPHQKFLSSVNQIGINKAVPKQILELMNVPGITRENVASHLQKSRLHLRKLSQAKQNEFLRLCSGEAARTGQQKSLNFPALCALDQIPAQTLASLEPVILGRSSRSLSVPPMGHQNLQHASMQGWLLIDCQTNMFNGSPHSKIAGSNNSSHCAINMQISHLPISSQAPNIFQGGESAVLLNQNCMEAPSRLLNNSPAWSNPVFMSLNSIVVPSQPQSRFQAENSPVSSNRNSWYNNGSTISDHGLLSSQPLVLDDAWMKTLAMLECLMAHKILDQLLHRCHRVQLEVCLTLGLWQGLCPAKNLRRVLDYLIRTPMSILWMILKLPPTTWGWGTLPTMVGDSEAPDIFEILRRL